MSPQEQPIRILVIDDQWMIREGLASLAGLDDDIEVVATGSDGRQAIELAAEHLPDVILMDIKMPVLDGIDAAREIVAAHPATKVLMLTTFDEQALIEGSLAAGAVGYLTKDIAAADLARSIRSAVSGLIQLSPEVTRILLAKPVAPESPAPPRPEPSADDSSIEELSERERQVLTLVAGGMSNREIGRELHLSPGTVKNHVSAILRRLGTADRTQAAVMAAKNGLI